MQHLLQVSRKVDYALRAMIYLASQRDGAREPLQEIAKKNSIPRDFLAKILKVLGDAGLVSAIRGPGGGVAIARPPAEISFLDVIEAVEFHLGRPAVERAFSDSQPKLLIHVLAGSDICDRYRAMVDPHDASAPPCGIGARGKGDEFQRVALRISELHSRHATR